MNYPKPVQDAIDILESKMILVTRNLGISGGLEYEVAKDKQTINGVIFLISNQGRAEAVDLFMTSTISEMIALFDTFLLIFEKKKFHEFNDAEVMASYIEELKDRLKDSSVRVGLVLGRIAPLTWSGGTSTMTREHESPEDITVH